MATNRNKILEDTANAVSTNIVAVPIFDMGDRNTKADDVPRAGVTMFYEALAPEVPLIQPTRKAYMQSQVACYFVCQADDSDADALGKIEQCKESAIEFATRLRFNASLTSYPLGEPIDGLALNYLYDLTDSLLVGAVLTCTIRFDPAYQITACDI